MRQRTNRRTPINGVRQILTVRGKDPSYEYRIVNDQGDNVQQRIEQGYEIVTDQTVTVGDKRIANPTSEGAPVQVSVGGGVKAYVMRIKKEWYNEDQEAKKAQVAELDKSMQQEAKTAADYGKLEIKV